MLFSSSLVSSVMCVAGAVVTYQSFPERVLKRKLGALLRTNDFHADLKGHKNKTYRIPPVVKSVSMYIDRKEATFQLPVGSDPNEVLKKSWVFQQVFGIGAEVSMIDARTFIMSIYTSSIQSFSYAAEIIDEQIIGLKLPIYVGKDRHGHVLYDLVEHPHLLVAGETGSGKSATVRSILTTLIRNVPNLDLYCADMKKSEFHLFKGIARAVVYKPHDVLAIVTMIRLEMSRRGDVLESAGVAHIDDLEEQLNYIILAIDEVALLKKDKSVMEGIEEISTIGRALGVFLILAVQRPDAQVFDGKLKQNLTVRLALKQADEINSRIVIGSGEAAKIKEDERGRMVMKMNGLKYVQSPNLELADARELLSGYKSPIEIRKMDHQVSSNNTDQDDYIEIGVL